MERMTSLSMPAGRPSLYKKFISAWNEYRAEKAVTRAVNFKTDRIRRVIFDVAGLASLSVAAGMIALPLGLAITGIALFTLNYRLDRSGQE
jgi:hypothetical protein